MKEEDNRLKKAGTENAFHVPEGYFENLTSEIMSKLPQKEEETSGESSVTMWTKMKPLMYMAAFFVGAAIFIRVGSHYLSTMESESTQPETHTEMVSDQMIDMAMDQMMMDDYSLYVYLNEPTAE